MKKTIFILAVINSIIAITGLFIQTINDTIGTIMFIVGSIGNTLIVLYIIKVLKKKVDEYSNNIFLKNVPKDIKSFTEYQNIVENSLNHFSEKTLKNHFSQLFKIIESGIKEQLTSKVDNNGILQSNIIINKRNIEVIIESKELHMLITNYITENINKDTLCALGIDDLLKCLEDFIQEAIILETTNKLHNS